MSPSASVAGRIHGKKETREEFFAGKRPESLAAAAEGVSVWCKPRGEGAGFYRGGGLGLLSALPLA